MTHFFSPSTAGFYDAALHKQVPEDAITLDGQAYALLLAEQAQGKMIAVVDGAVLAVVAPPPPAETQLAVIRSRRNRLLAATDAMIGVPDFPISNDRRAELIAWRAQLRDVPDLLDPTAPFDTAVWPAPPLWMDDTGTIIMPEQN